MNFIMATSVNCAPGIMDRTPIKSGFDGYQRLKNDHELFLEAYESKNKPTIFMSKPSYLYVSLLVKFKRLCLSVKNGKKWDNFAQSVYLQYQMYVKCNSLNNILYNYF